ncbi:MAG: hypothetical protein GDA55_02385 [Cellvibrionales bacterium]|nr:hypothetical protein [Cellvibrionales bacterium]
MKSLFIKIYLAISLLATSPLSRAEELFSLTERDLDLHVIVTYWALHHLGAWNTPFSKPDNHAAAVPYLPVLYVVHRHMTDVVLDWQIIQAHLLINYPELGIAWLAAYERDFEVALWYGKEIFLDPCSPVIDSDDIEPEAVLDLGYQMIDSLQKYVNDPDTLSHKREIAIQLLTAYREMAPKKGSIKDFWEYCQHSSSYPKQV